MNVTRQWSNMSILYNVHVVASRTDSALTEAIDVMTPSDFALYSLIRAKGPLSPREISQRHGTPPSSVSAALQRYEASGHVRRLPHPTDARTFLIELTEAGTDTHGEARSQFMDVLKPLTTELGSDLDTVRFALRRLASALATLEGLDDYGDLANEDNPHAGALDYHGPALTGDEQQSVRDHIDYLLWRRAR